jgi:membrane-associated protease RseP (regulator of RpoE activity)
VVDTSGALELRPVKVAAFTEDAALVTSGLSNGDRIVKFGVQKLAAGERVRAIDER